MLAKLIAIIIVAGATACALLVNRQHRIDTAHEIALIHHRLLQQEQMLWRLRSDIAARTRPGEVRAKIEMIGGVWVAIPAADARQGSRREKLLAQIEPEATDDHALPETIAAASGL